MVIVVVRTALDVVDGADGAEGPDVVEDGGEGEEVAVVVAREVRPGYAS